MCTDEIKDVGDVKVKPTKAIQGHTHHQPVQPEGDTNRNTFSTTLVEPSRISMENRP